MNRVPNEIIEYLLNKFSDVEAIILHGSRVNGYAKQHSDWDFIVLVNTKQQQDIYRDEIKEHHFEFKLEELPILENTFFDRFQTKLQFSEVVYDKKDKGQKLLDFAHTFYQGDIPKTFHSHELKEHRKRNRLHVVRNLEDAIDNPASFMKKIATLYPQIINEWYWYKKQSFPKNLYLSLPQIEKEDNHFHEKLKIIYGDDFSRADKIAALKDSIEYIYG
ncbi:MAG: nucleotidyltransferase domain-containing protein [Candidatus Pacebacteria bacterium]|nr:nucleotidyltransferase domain-containing protein [Candidatus Paceibacterota bacterium]